MKHNTSRILRTTVIESLLGVRKFSEDSPQRAQRTQSWGQREVDLSKNFPIPLSFLCELCVLRGECSEFFGCGSAALGSSCPPLKVAAGKERRLPKAVTPESFNRGLPP